MRDRIPTYPGRVKLEPVSGQTNVYDMTRADEPTQEGTPLNKASLLTDAVASAFGLDDAAVPNDVLNILKKSTLCVYEENYKEYVNIGEIPAGTVITLNESGNPVEFYVAQHNYESGLNGIGRTLLVRKDIYGKHVWNSTNNTPTYATSSIDSWLNSTYKALLDAEVQDAIGTTSFKYTPTGGTTTVGTLDRSVFLLSVTELGQTAGFENIEGTALDISNFLLVAHMDGSPYYQYTRSPSNSDSSYVLSISGAAAVNRSSPNQELGARPAFTLPASYPYTVYIDENGDAHTEQEYTTILTDVLGNEINAGARVEVGSYVGTGTVGSSGPNTLSFSFNPKFVFIIQGGAGGYWSVFVRGGPYGAGAKFWPDGFVILSQAITWGDRSISWYIYSAGTTSGLYDLNGGQIYQLNSSRGEYHYVAIG